MGILLPTMEKENRRVLRTTTLARRADIMEERREDITNTTTVARKDTTVKAQERARGTEEVVWAHSLALLQARVSSTNTKNLCTMISLERQEPSIRSRSYSVKTKK